MALSDIDSINISADKNQYVYDISTKERCEGAIIPVLSKTKEPKKESIIETTAEWVMSSGTITVDSARVKDLDELFIYLRDDSEGAGGATTTAVRVFVAPLIFKKARLLLDGCLSFMVDSDSSDFEYAEQIVLSFANGKGYNRYVKFKKDNARIGMELAMLTDMTKSFSFSLCYAMTDEGAEVFSIPCEEQKLYISAPGVTGTQVNMENDRPVITVSGNLLKDVPLYGWLFAGDRLVSEGEVKNGKLEAGSIFDFSPAEEVSLEMCYRTACGDSLHSRRVPVVTGVVQALCTFHTDHWQIQLDKEGTYQVTYGKTTASVRGNVATILKDNTECEIRCKEGSSIGIKTKVSLTERAIYSITTGEKENAQVFFLAADRPDGCSFDKDIIIGLSGQLGEGKAYQGVYFTLQTVEGKTSLTMKKDAYTAERESVHQDYLSMLSAVAADGGLLLYDEIRTVVWQKLPICAGEELFWRYAYQPKGGVIELSEGMRLLTEYTLYQNVPGASQSNANLSGFVGTGCCAYHIIRRDGKLTFDPFATEISFSVPSPGSMGSDRKLSGGAGMSDLLYQGFAAKYMRLVYPTRYTDRHTTGDLGYDNNVCLMTADRPELLDTAVRNMRAHALGVNGVSYHYFRGRSMVIPQICVEIEGRREWISVGTKLSDIFTQNGNSKCSMYRSLDGSLLEIKRPMEGMRLLAGDCLMFEEH